MGACSVPQTPSHDSSEGERVHWQRTRAVTRVWGPWEMCGCSRAGSGRQQSEANKGTMTAPLGTCAWQSGQALMQNARSTSAARDHPQARLAGGGRQGSPTKGAAWGQLHREQPSQGAQAMGDSSPGLSCWEEGEGSAWEGSTEERHSSLGASRTRHRGILEAPPGTSTRFPRVGTNTRVMFQENPLTKDLCDHMQTSTMSYPSLFLCPSAMTHPIEA